MATDDLNIAKESLRIREGIPKSKIETSISSIAINEKAQGEIDIIIQNWARV